METEIVIRGMRLFSMQGEWEWVIKTLYYVGWIGQYVE